MRPWFEDAKLGIFIHYGIYAVDGVSESWSFHNGVISYEEYMKQLNGFTASRFDADQWAELIERSGAKYAVLTTKHHDGVALFDTQYSGLSVVKRTPAERDIVKEYAEAIKKRGIRLGMYYSLIDWSHPDYPSVYPSGVVPEDLNQVNRFSEPLDGIQDEERWQSFLEFNRNQLKEILTRYGAVDLLWFDGDWERSAEQWGLPEFKTYLRSFNPDLIFNSRLAGHGDYKTPEQGLPITRPEGPWEFCTTINTSWGYQPKDHNYKSLNQMIRMFCDCISMGGNMLLNIGPREDGTIDSRQVDILLGLGDWIRTHEEAVYGTAEGIMTRYWLGGSTLSKDRRTLYLFVYDDPKESVCLKGLCNPIRKITVLHTGKELNYDIHGGVPWFNIPGTTWIYMTPEDCHAQVTVLKLEFAEPIEMYGGSGAVVTHN
ncbi:alpha-L-fucosidase [Paenibacillus sp. DXFW5]|uniref:alpha-L-fucosidase n=1 Tax=Paenibacillus rhizolycopersici TaxID=2780073 RepID=A0ABS2H0P5_9BACL|nr:alpha-L-fucosidase [Paenibacillus rhizolycopersici]MBM6994188.1 alpha-L-fucosidase [Paenibacillus rhizolycopersici]